MNQFTIAAASVLILLAGQAQAQIGGKKKADDRVKALLVEAELKYQVDEDGDYKVILPIGDDRNQIVFIRSRTSTLKDMEIREVFSVGYISDDEMPSSVAKNLLKENGKVKLGAWEVNSIGGRELGIFRAKIAADTDMKTLLLTLLAVCKTADNKEKELMSKDDF